MLEKSISCVKIVKKINNLQAKSSIKPKIICNLQRKFAKYELRAFPSSF